MDFEEYMNARRMRLGITQRELAEKADISTSYLNLIESGKKRPTPTVIRKIGQALGGDPEEWLDLAGYKVPELNGAEKGMVDSQHAPALRVIGTIGADASEYFGDNGPTEPFAVRVARVLDTSCRALGYEKGDLLMIDDQAPAPGEVVIRRIGGGSLAINTFDKSMHTERIIGRVTGLIRRFHTAVDEGQALESSLPDLSQLTSKEDIKKALGDIQTLLTKINSEIEDVNEDGENPTS